MEAELSTPVMGASDSQETYFYLHTLAIGTDGRLRLLEPEQVSVCGRRVAVEART